MKIAKIKQDTKIVPSIQVMSHLNGDPGLGVVVVVQGLVQQAAVFLQLLAALDDDLVTHGQSVRVGVICPHDQTLVRRQQCIKVQYDRKVHRGIQATIFHQRVRITQAANRGMEELVWLMNRVAQLCNTNAINIQRYGCSGKGHDVPKAVCVGSAKVIQASIGDGSCIKKSVKVNENIVQLDRG